MNTETSTGADRDRIARQLRRRRADLAVANIYSDERGGRPFDMTYGRRISALNALEARARETARELLRADANPDAELPTDAELEAAFRRLCSRYLAGREHVSTGVVDALDATRQVLEEDYDLELDRTDALQAACDGGRGSSVYPSGASRSGR